MGGYGVYLVVFTIYSVVCGAIARAVSSNRGMEGGFGWGFFLGIIGIIVVALRPYNRTAPVRSEVEPPAPPKAQDSNTVSNVPARIQVQSKTAVFSLPNDLYSTGSPVIITSCSLLKDKQTDAMSVRLVLQNISAKPIIAAQIRVRPMDTAGRVLGEGLSFHYLDLHVEIGKSFGANKEFSLPDSTTREISVKVAEVIFSDKSVWQAEEEQWEPLPTTEDLARVLNDEELVKQFRIKYGGPCKVMPREHRDLWLCTCGNWNREEGCWHCRKKKTSLLSFDIKALTADMDARLACERANREAKETAEKAAAIAAAEKAAAIAAAEKAEAAARSKRVKKTLVILVSLVSVCAAALLFTFKVFIPNKKYAEAVSLYNAGRYSEAITVFRSLSGYKDSAVQIYACQTRINDIAYNEALALKESGQYKEAVAAFESLYGYKDSASMVEACNNAIKDEGYNEAMALYTAEKYEEAKSAFEKLNGYKDSNEKVTSCETAIQDAAYASALALLQKGDYENAITAFKALNGFKDSAKQMEKATMAYLRSPLINATVGSIVFFGAYEQDGNTANGKEAIEWQVLEKKKNRILVISKYALDYQRYNRWVVDKDTTWETCVLREWLNGTFLNNAFSADEQKLISRVTVWADKNPNYGTNPGKATTDQIFLLSIPEVKKYFTSEEARLCLPTKYAISQGASTFYKYSWWWLRTPGETIDRATGVSASGHIYYVGREKQCEGDVRPAMWIDLG